MQGNSNEKGCLRNSVKSLPRFLWIFALQVNRF